MASTACFKPLTNRAAAAAENCFGELKNQWGWNGYTSRRLASSRLMANFIALVYNWWNLYLRFYDEEHHREAIRPRPILMSGGRPAGQKRRAANRQSQRPARKRRHYRLGRHTHQQRVAAHSSHHGAMERRATLDALVGPPAAPLAGRQMATRPSGRC